MRGRKKLLEVLRAHRPAIGYSLDDLKGISPALCMHKINLEEDAKPVVDYQCRLHPKMKEVVRKEVIKLIEDGIIYTIADSKWVSHVHCVPKKGGITVVPNDENELVAQRTVTGYRMCIDFRKLNKTTHNDHYPLPFIDQMLERLSNHSHFCYLDGYSFFLKFLCTKMIKKRLLLLVPLVLLLTEECHFVYAMLLLLFKDA